MARLEPLAPPYAPELAEELAAMMPPGLEPLRLFRTLAHNPRVLRKFRLGNLLDRGSLSRREREIVILRTCARCGAEYEWGVHATAFARRFGLCEEQLAASARGDATDPAWSPRDRLLVRLVDALHEQASIPGTLWNDLAEHWSPAQLVELLVLTGFYHTVSFVVTGLEVELEEQAERFPPPA